MEAGQNELGRRLISVDEVYHEITRQDDELAKWAKTKKEIFDPLTEEVQDAAKDIVNKFVKLLGLKRTNLVQTYFLSA